MNSLLDWEVSSEARIGVSFIDADRLKIEADARIGHGNIIKGLDVMHVGASCIIGNFNFVTCDRAMCENDEGQFLVLKRGAAITYQHYLDCTGGITIGKNAIVAGVRSTVLSHQIDLSENIQRASSVDIGDYVFVASNVRIAAGSSIAPRSVVAMGSVVVHSLTDSDSLYAGAPCRRRRAIEGEWFHRAQPTTKYVEKVSEVWQ